MRTANRLLIEAVDARKPSLLIVDATVQALLPVTVIDQLQDLERELAERDVELWFAVPLGPGALATAAKDPAMEQARGRRSCPPDRARGGLGAFRQGRRVKEPR